jgi:hypothetical protein
MRRICWWIYAGAVAMIFIFSTQCLGQYGGPGGYTSTNSGVPYWTPSPTWNGVRTCPDRSVLYRVKLPTCQQCLTTGIHTWNINGSGTALLCNHSYDIWLHPGAPNWLERHTTPYIFGTTVTDWSIPIYVPDLSVNGGVYFTRKSPALVDSNDKWTVTLQAYVTPIINDPLRPGINAAVYAANTTKSYGWSGTTSTGSFDTHYVTGFIGDFPISVTLTGGCTVCGKSWTGQYTEQVYTSGLPFNFIFNKSAQRTSEVSSSLTISFISTSSGSLARVGVPLNAEGDATIIMTDILGRRVFKEHFEMGGHRSFDIQLSSLSIPSGIYLVHVEGGGMQATQKVWKQ